MTALHFRNSRIMTIILGIAACLVVVCIVLYPDRILKASLEGLTIWWKIVFPAMLPFLIVTEMMAGLGVMHFIGTWLEPVMRRLFGLPGIAGWCVAVGWTAGSPAGARSIAKLRKEGALTRHQAERLMALTHVGSPVLLMIVIASGFLGHPELGLPLLIIHWIGAIVSAFAAGGMEHRRDADGQSGAQPRSSSSLRFSPSERRAASSSRSGLFAASLQSMYDARDEDGRTFGRLLGDSVFESVQKLLVIGGYMIFFSVALKILMLAGIGTAVARFAEYALLKLGIPGGELAGALFNGLFEQHLGAYAVHDAAPDIWLIAAISAVLGWSGLCLHAQVKAACSGTDIRYYPFLLSRLIHAAAGVVLTLLVHPLLNIRAHESPGFRLHGETIPVWSSWPEPPLARHFPSFADMILCDLRFGLAALALLALGFILSAAIHRLERFKRRLP